MPSWTPPRAAVLRQSAVGRLRRERGNEGLRRSARFRANERDNQRDNRTALTFPATKGSVMDMGITAA